MHRARVHPHGAQVHSCTLNVRSVVEPAHPVRVQPHRLAHRRAARPFAILDDELNFHLDVLAAKLIVAAARAFEKRAPARQP